MKHDEYTHQVKTHETLLHKLESTSNTIGYVKLIMVLLLAVMVYFLFAWGLPLGLGVITALWLVALIVLWVYHHRLHQKIDYSRGIIAINMRHLARINGQWTSFSDIGEEFVDREHPYGGDLDIVGPKSFFQFINTTNTWYGRQALAQDLLAPDFSNDDIRLRQKAVHELGQDIVYSNDMEHSFSKIGIGHKFDEKLGEHGGYIKSKAAQITVLYLPMLTLITLVLVAMFAVDFMMLAISIVVMVQGVIWLATVPKTLGYLAPISRLPYKLGAYSTAIDKILGKKFESRKLTEIQHRLAVDDLSAANALKELSSIANKVNLRHNTLLWFAANVLLQWDSWCAIMFEKWLHKYAHSAQGWFLAIGEFESLLSLSNLPNVLSNTCLPTISGGKGVTASAMGHPLIPSYMDESTQKGTHRVDNDISITDEILIISGSNMSGKTTFMRTVGINLVLARAGSYVCANKMQFSPLKIMTSMRVSDDLSQGLSTFYAELKRIKGIIALAEENPQMIFLIDEIFRGTNSVDRLSGARTVLARLHELGVVGVITTHDLELCDIADLHTRVDNYSFSEEYAGGQIKFDYKLRKGRSTTTNARFLMEMIGI